MEKNEHHASPAQPLRRIKALIIDLFILLVPGILINNYLVQLHSDKITLTLYSGLFNIASFAYFIYFTYRKDGMTLGKKLMKIKVVSLDGKLTLAQIVLRYMVFFLAFWEVPFLMSAAGAKQISDLLSIIVIVLAAAMLFLDKRHQVFHDKIAKTLVVEKNPK